MMPQIRTERKDVTPDGRARTRVGSLLPALRAALILAAVMALAPSALAATYTVTKTADTRDGSCDADCSLREAVIAANANPGADIINVPVGTFTLTLAPTGDDASNRGDLDINDSVSIIGVSPAQTIIQTSASAFSGYDRVFDIGRLPVASIAASFSNLTIRNGKANPGGGGGIRFDGLFGGLSTGSLMISNCVLSGNQAQSDGGAIRSVNGSLTINNSTIDNNKAVDGDGGGIYHSSSQPMTVTNTTFSNNTATGTTTDQNGNLVFGDGGGAFVGGNAAATSTFTATTFTGNQASNPSTADTNVSQAPTISCPADISVNLSAGQSTASVSFSVSSTGNPAPTVACAAGGSPVTSPHNFSVGTTNVQCTATNSAGTVSCDFDVTVSDHENPTITAPADITVSADGNCAATGVSLGTPTTADNVGVASVTNNAPASFPLGTTVVTWTVTDTSGNTATATQNVVVNDTTDPTITAPPNVTVDADANSCGASPALGTPTTADNCAVASVTNNAPASFPVGTTTVTWTVTDTAGHSKTATQTVTVVDNTNPTVSAPANITVNNEAGSCGASVDPGTATGADNCSGVTVAGVRSDGLPLNAAYPVGTTTITWTATDASNRTATATQSVTVNDTENPVVNAPANINANTDAGSCSAALNPGTATATDNCAGATVAGVRSDGQALNAPYPKGTTTITWTATDAAGRTSSATQTINVADDEDPTVSAPANITVSSAANSCSAVVNPGTATAADNCGGATVAGVRSDGQALNAAYPAGTTTITWTATDTSGNTKTATQTVTVNDTTGPTITGPTEVVVTLPLNSPATSAVVNYPAFTTSDNCAGTVTLSFSIPSGSSFPVGSTAVTATATDAAGNTATHNFVVRVLFNFTGFFSPVANLPTVNQVNAGRSIPVKFSLSGNKGLDIFAPGYPASAQYTCSESAPEVDIDGQPPVSGNSLTYDAGSGQYNFVWKTEGSWAGQCRQLIVVLKDGSVYRANFKFK